MQLSLRTPAVRAAFLDKLAETGFMNAAGAAVGISQSAINQYRARHADFAAACDAARAGPSIKPAFVRWTPALEAAFLEALAETGSAVVAARRTGVTYSNAYRRRGREANFAAAWWRAVREAGDRLEDILFEGAATGFVKRTERGGVVTTVTAQRPDMMLKVLARRQTRQQSHRTMELTPQVLNEARTKFEAAVTRAVARVHARYGAAGLPEMFGPHWHGLDRAIATLPAPKVL